MVDDNMEEFFSQIERKFNEQKETREKEQQIVKHEKLVRKKKPLQEQLAELSLEESRNEGTKVSPKDFYLEKRCGSGAFGSVYKAQWPDKGIVVAVKRMPRDKHYSKEMTKNELETLRKLRHTNITSYHGCCFTKDEDWIVMEFCEIGSIENIMDTLGETIAERYIAIIIKAILQALDYLHNDAKVLHRDLKSANILLTPDCDVKIADFGVSRELQRQLTFNAYGTPHWMAPEIWSEQGYTYPADIWSLGITAYEMAEGDPPNSDLGPLFLYLKIKKEGPPRLPENTEYYTKEFRDFIRKCLTIDPSKRPTARQLLSHPFIKNAEHKSALEGLISRYKDKVREKKRAEKEKEKKREEEKEKEKK